MQTNSINTKTTLRRSIVALATAALLVIAGPVDAQQTAVAGGSVAQATVRSSVGMVMPVLMMFKRTAQPTATRQGERFTEYVIRYTVASNARWEVAVLDLPQGVTVMAADGAWVAGSTSPVVVDQGVPTDPTEVVIRVRVADGASATWHADLNVNAGRVGSF